MQLVDLKFKPGVDKQDSAYSAGDQRKYIDSDFVRFHYGKPERWGGWAFLPNPNKTVVGVVRDTHSWIGLDGTRYLALGTDRKLYIYSEGKLYDITPLRQTESLSNPFTTNGTTTVSVADAAHGASVGDFVTFDSFSTIDGLDMNKEFEVTSVTSASAYTVTHTSTASGSTSGGGGSGNAKYQISVGPATSTYGYGWGTETWGASTWDTARSSSNVVVAGRNWSLDNFGEDLIATVLDGGTFIWDTSGGLSARATALSNAPTASRFSIVSTDTRHLMIFGTETTIGDTATQDDLLFRFSDREDATDYTPVATNEAGSLRITDGSRIIGDVEILKNSSVWFNCVIRGDVNNIKIGENTNIQDGTIIHVSSNGFSANGKMGYPTVIGDNVTIGHNATIHACKIDDFSLIGMGSVVLDNAKIEKYAFVAAGAVVTPGTIVKKFQLWAGNPAKFIREINNTEKKLLENTPDVYDNLSKEFLKK